MAALAQVCGAAQVLHEPDPSCIWPVQAYSAHHKDAFSFAGNPASLGRMDRPSAGLASERKFLLRELSTYYAMAAVPYHRGSFGFAGRYSGFSGFNDARLGLAYGRALTEKVDLGVQFNYFQVSIAGYGHASTVYGAAGLLFHPTDQVHAGFTIINPAGGALGKSYPEKIATQWVFGWGIDLTQELFIGGTIDQAETQPVQVQAGIRYCPVTRLMIRLGVNAGTGSVFFGTGFWLRHMRLDVTAAYHQQLGITPGVGLLFAGKEKSAEQ